MNSGSFSMEWLLGERASLISKYSRAEQRSHHWLQKNINRLALTFGRPVLGVHNKTLVHLVLLYFYLTILAATGYCLMLSNV